MLRVIHLESQPRRSEELRALLSRQGVAADVVSCATPEAFLARVGEGGFQAVLAEVGLCAERDWSALRQVRAAFPGVPVILFGPTPPLESVVEAVRRGVTDVVPHHQPERLRELLERAVRTEARAASASVERHERWFRALTDNALDVITVLDAGGVVRYESPACARVVGFLPEDLLGKSGFEFIHPEDRPRVEEVFRELVATPDMTGMLEFRFRHRDGGWRSLEAVGRSLLHDPAIGGVVVNSRDVTERRLAEDRLRQSEERFRQISENVADLIAVLDLEGRRVYNSPSYRRLLGDLEALKGTSSFDEIHPADRERIRRIFKETVVSGVGQRAEFRFLLPDGSVRFVESQGSVIRDAAGRVVNVIVVSRDVTERRRAEEQIREQAALLDKAQDAICVTDLDQRIVYWNRSAETLYGWTVAEAHGRLANELLFRGDGQAAMEALKALIARREWKGELRQVSKAGKDLIVESRWTLIHDSEGQPKSILVINTDITEKKHLETQFYRSQRLENIGMLASGVAHDLNNVLAPMMMAVPMLRDYVSDPEAHRFLDTLEKSVQRGAELVGQILSFGRGGEQDEKLIQMRHLMADVENIVRETFPKAIRFRKDAPRDLRVIRANPTQMHQILLNLCVNARDAMPSGGLLTLLAENGQITPDHVLRHPGAKVGPCIVISLTDSGTGIPPEIRERMFEPFFTTKEVGKGTGLGLATVKGIVKNQRGFVEVESEVGRGSTFRVYLPAEERADAAAEAVRAGDVASGQGELILVVDDEAAIRQIGKATLENYGYRVLMAEHGAEAVTLFRQYQAEVRAVILDSIMPYLDGPATLRALREIDPRVRVVGVSGLTAVEGLSKGDRGVQAFLTKPYTASQLLAALREALSAQPPSG